ncbi:sensor histidine kinase [Streptomyces torulosus]|uniref:sensor histidine kinase n=1 Tax=Streptomyces torulosus TaxID=68276 RepID=UPI001F0A0B12|nr:HAMP domain-containing sensor histidine kinase [Streptomyces torulosus]
MGTRLRGLRIGLRFKIGMTIAATAAVSATLTGRFVPGIVQDDRRDSVLAEYQEAARHYREGRVTAGLEVDPVKVPEDLRRAVGPGGARSVTYLEADASGTTVWAAGPGEDGQLLAFRRHFPQTLFEDLEHATRSAAVVGALGASIVGIGLAAAMARRLRRSTRQVDRIKDGELDARLPQRGRDEIAQLSAAVNAMAQALAARIETERAVTANIAHELRTPIAGLLTASSLLPGDDRPAEMVRERAVRLRDLMEDVLEVARIDNGGERAEPREVELAALARRVVAGVRADRPQAAVAVEVIHDTVRETDPRRLDRVLTNLVTNALRHGAEPVVVEVDGPELRVRDHGPGFPPELIAHGPQRFRTGGNGGLGLGLAIATGQAGVIGARLRWHNPPEGGAVATITLPPTPAAEASQTVRGDAPFH